MRKKKYEIIHDLHDIFNDSEFDLFRVHPRFVASSYTISTNGGRMKFWQVNAKEPFFTVSSGAESQKTISNGGARIRVEFFRHYVLTAEGVQYIQERLVEEAL